ncbi:formylglycine-generating enzyme family protein [Zavarzinella formosa]|uniref:formylglycine-generating enzyme family protein n=1 Tax=Zavarzinella formosa TaxID=360055 RepID=UPI0003150116|nr:formylglycine-generating enzyme family protein [Zavarzinella formosa]
MFRSLILLLLLPSVVLAEPKPGEERDFEIFKGVKMRFCWIPAGKAMLGSVPDGKKLVDDEKEHEFSTKGYWLAKYEVTQAEYEGVIGSNPSKDIGERLPVENVSWEDCQSFIKKCSVSGLAVKLPHEDQWEYACRGGKGNKQAYYWGDVLSEEKANCWSYPKGKTRVIKNEAKTTIVGSYEKTAKHPWGLCDMSGNVAEWCDNFYKVGSENRAMRGGSLVNDHDYCRSGVRFAFSPTLRMSFFGFRVALIP